MTTTNQTLTPDTTGAEVMGQPTTFRLCTGSQIRCDPASEESLDETQTAIINAALRMGIDGRVMFTAARRQLGDIEVTRAAMATGRS